MLIMLPTGSRCAADWYPSKPTLMLNIASPILDTKKINKFKRNEEKILHDQLAEDEISYTKSDEQVNSITICVFLPGLGTSSNSVRRLQM